MQAFDIIGYVGDGQILCDKCGAKYDHNLDSDTVSPIFADSDLRPGETCGECGAFYRPDGSWSAPRGTDSYRADLGAYRWITCDSCNHQEPRDATDARTRRDALYGKIACPNCWHGRMHF